MRLYVTWTGKSADNRGKQAVPGAPARARYARRPRRHAPTPRFTSKRQIFEKRHERGRYSSLCTPTRCTVVVRVPGALRMHRAGRGGASRSRQACSTHGTTEEQKGGGAGKRATWYLFARCCTSNGRSRSSAPVLESIRCANPGLSTSASPDSLHSEQTPVNGHVPGKGRRMSRRRSSSTRPPSLIAPRHAPQHARRITAPRTKAGSRARELPHELHRGPSAGSRIG